MLRYSATEGGLLPIQYVVDSNFLQSQDLRNFLSKSQSNKAILTDYAAMEAYKGDTLQSIFRSMKILAEFPEQVVVLKGTKSIGALSGRTSSLRKRMVDMRSTREFSDFCAHLKAAQAGDQRVISQLLDHGEAASQHMEKILADAQGIPETYGDIESTYTKDDIREFRSGGPYSRKTLSKMLGLPS